MSVVFSMGSAHGGRSPNAAEVLDALASDASGYDNSGGDFASWCSEYGVETEVDDERHNYQVPNRAAKKTFNAIAKQAASLKKFLGADLYETLLYKTESM